MQWCTVGLPAVKIKMQIGELFLSQNANDDSTCKKDL